MADADIPVPVTFNAVLEGTEVENHTAEWYHRITTSGDPVIRARTHNSGGPYIVKLKFRNIQVFCSSRLF